MVNGKTPPYLTLLVAAGLVAAGLWLQPYSADFPGTAFAKPAKRYIRAALDQDSVALARLSVSQAPVGWALHVARTHSNSLESWTGQVQAWTGVRKGDTTQVFVFAAGDRCGLMPIELQFVGSGDHAKVASAGSRCMDSGP